MSTTIKPGQQAEQFLSNLADAITEQMLKGAEPVIQRAIEDMERKMRARARECAVAIIDRSFEFQANREVMTIRISQSGDKFPN